MCRPRGIRRRKSASVRAVLQCDSWRMVVDSPRDCRASTAFSRSVRVSERVRRMGVFRSGEGRSSLGGEGRLSGRLG